LVNSKTFYIFAPVNKKHKNMTNRNLYEIANEITNDWVKVSPYAKQYLDAMHCLTSVNDKYGFDSGKSIVLYFLSNASQWKGDKAKTIKKELKQMVGLK